MKKVVEKLQLENERLKKTPGIVNSEQLKSLGKENAALREQLEELRSKVGASLSERYESQQMGVQRIKQDYEKLRKDLRKEIETNEKLKLQLQQVERNRDRLHADLETVKAKLHGGESKIANKTNVTTHLYETRIKELEDDLEKKVIHH